MNLQQLESLGAFAPAKPIQKAVKWVRPTSDTEPGGEVSFSVWIRQLSAGMVDEILADQAAMREEGKKAGKSPKDIRRSVKAVILSESVYLGEDEKHLALIPYDKAYQLRPALADALWAACDEVNAVSKEDPSDPKG
jgi:hypothetical protein